MNPDTGLSMQTRPHRAPHDPALGFARAWPAVLATIAALALIGWFYLGAMIAAMIPVMDMATAGPGMGLFNRFNDLAGLPAEVRAALAALCLPTAATTFGMPTPSWSGLDLLKAFLMWSMMALAMMLPGAIPMLNAYARMQAGAGRGASHITRTTLAAALGYLAIWGGYALIATGAQWVLTSAGLLGAMMAPLSLAVSASVLIAAGIYQFTLAKHACLDRCWYPRWVFLRGDSRGQTLTEAWREGVWQGLICLGCCWAVMTVMFAVGLMNIVWIALLGGLMAVEKTFPNRVLSPAIGALFLVWGGGLATAIWLGLAV